MEEEFTSVEEVHYEVKFGFGLEGVVELYDEGTVNLFKNISLSYKKKILTSPLRMVV